MTTPDRFPSQDSPDPKPLPPGFGLWRENQFEDPGFRFVLPLPQDWVPVGEPGKPPAKPGTAAPLARYTSVEEPRVEITVSGCVSSPKSPAAGGRSMKPAASGR